MKQLFGIVLIFLSFTAAANHRLNDNFSEHKTDSIKPIAYGRNAKGIPVSFASLSNYKNAVARKGILGTTREGRMIEAYYFPGHSDKRAIVIGGMHGSELSSIEIASVLIAELEKGRRPYYSVIVIPSLFPDNAQRAIENPDLIGGTGNIGRYTSSISPDPNRQMPALGKPFNSRKPNDDLGRTIEQENQALLELIDKFRPQRIINIHAIREKDRAGIFADPRTLSNGLALDYESDSSLAIRMALHIFWNGGEVKGNKLGIQPTSLYHNDPHIAAAGTIQLRNLKGSSLPAKRGHGVSLGSWATTAVEDNDHPQLKRAAIRLITMEFPGYKRSIDYADPLIQIKVRKNIKLYASSILEIFLGNHEVEEADLLTIR